VSDGPFYVIAAEVEAQAKAGHICFQKFTCAKCGSRQAFDVPNVMYMTGSWPECGHVTDLVAPGCGFALIMSTTPEARAALNRILDTMTTDEPETRPDNPPFTP